MAGSGVYPKVSGDRIYLADYNAIQSLVYSVKTNFYKAVCVSAQIPANETVTHIQWNNLKTDIDYCVAIQGIPLSTTLTTKVAGQLITAADVNLYKIAADQINANKVGYYSLTADLSSVNENASVTFTISTTYVPDGTTLYWSTSGSTAAADYTDSQTVGSVAVSSPTGVGGTATVVRTLTADNTTEGSETFIFYVYSDSGRTQLVAQTGTITVNDTSTTPSPVVPPPPGDGSPDTGGSPDTSSVDTSTGIDISDMTGFDYSYDTSTGSDTTSSDTGY